MQAQQLREAEEQLKHQLVYGGYPEMWEQMLLERMKIRQAREKAEREARAHRKKVMAERIFLAQLVGGTITLCIIAFLVIAIIRQAMS